MCIFSCSVPSITYKRALQHNIAQLHLGQYSFMKGPPDTPTIHLYASKVIMRPERETEEHRDPCQGQMDSRYAEGPPRESGPALENAAPNRRAAAQKCSGDDYASRPVARHARAIQYGWRQDHRQVYTPGADALSVR